MAGLMYFYASLYGYPAHAIYLKEWGVRAIETNYIRHTRFVAAKRMRALCFGLAEGR